MAIGALASYAVQVHIGSGVVHLGTSVHAEPPMAVDPRPLVDLPLPPDPTPIDVPDPTWIPRAGHPHRDRR